jgi:hypothetical protein
MKYLKTMAIIISCSAITNTAIADLQTTRAVANDPTQRISATANFPTPVSGDLYLATQINGNFLFFTSGGQVTAEVRPFTQGGDYSGQVPLFDFPAEGIAPGRYPLYQVVTHPGTDPLDFNNWMGGLAGLSSINFIIGLPSEQSGDFDNDGFSDDDINKDGFHDDDLDKNGFHDDDLNQDGFHDDDLNQDGLSDVANIPEPAPEPVVTPTPEPVVAPVTNIIAEGQAAYASCASSACHGANPAFGQNGIQKARDPNATMGAIAGNQGGMGFLSAIITADSANKISAYLNSL